MNRKKHWHDYEETQLLEGMTELCKKHQAVERKFGIARKLSFNRLLPAPAGRPGMSIAIESSDENLRERLRKMSDEELVRFGKAARSLCRDPKCPEVFKRQLEEAKTEWRRRHPKAQ